MFTYNYQDCSVAFQSRSDYRICDGDAPNIRPHVSLHPRLYLKVDKINVVKQKNSLTTHIEH